MKFCGFPCDRSIQEKSNFEVKIETETERKLKSVWSKQVSSMSSFFASQIRQLAAVLAALEK